MNPTFVFDELVVTHYCGGLRGLIALVLTVLTHQAMAQGYKVVGSMELLGDPLSLVSKASDVEVGEGVCGGGWCLSNRLRMVYQQENTCWLLVMCPLAESSRVALP